MSRSVFARSLEPLAASLWGLLLGWSVILAIVWVGGMDEARVKHLVENEGLRTALAALSKSAVTVWLALALVNIHLAIARAECLSTSRRWLGMLLGGALVLGWVESLVKLPWGRIHFMDGLGMLLARVPLGWPLLWVTLIIGARELVLWARSRTGHLATVLAGTALVMLSFLNLEPRAHGDGWRWWFWYAEKYEIAAPPPWILLVLFVAGMSWLLRETKLRAQPHRRSRKPAIAFLIFNTLVLAAHLRLRFWPLEMLPVEL